MLIGTHRDGRPAPGLAALVALALLATGCGGGGAGETSSSSDSAGSTTTSGSASTAARIKEFGTEASGSEAKQPEAAAIGYLDARAAEEWSRACSFLATPIRRLLGHLTAKSQRVAGKGCAAFVETSTKKLSPSERAALAKSTPESVRLEGDRGYVLYRDGNGTERAVSVKREGGRWKVVDVAGTPPF